MGHIHTHEVSHKCFLTYLNTIHIIICILDDELEDLKISSIPFETELTQADYALRRIDLYSKQKTQNNLDTSTSTVKTPDQLPNTTANSPTQLHTVSSSKFFGAQSGN